VLARTFSSFQHFFLPTEIRTGLLENDDGRKEIQLVKGEAITITTNDDFKEKCSEKMLWVDYKNIPKVSVTIFIRKNSQIRAI
jgi:pyruvate kinase